MLLQKQKKYEHHFLSKVVFYKIDETTGHMLFLLTFQEKCDIYECKKVSLFASAFQMVWN